MSRQERPNLQSMQTEPSIDRSTDTEDREHSTSVKDSSQAADRKYGLQEQLREEIAKHLTEGGVGEEKLQERVGRIRQLREALREEEEKQGVSREKTNPSEQAEYIKAKEQRERLKVHHGRVIKEEMEKIEREMAQEQVSSPPSSLFLSSIHEYMHCLSRPSCPPGPCLQLEGPQRELQVLGGERQLLLLQLEALRTEAQQAERDLEAQYKRHRQEMHCVRTESVQVFRVFRQVCEEQRRLSEGRYRTVMLEAIQDAVYLSAVNQQLQTDNTQLRKGEASIIKNRH
ncbi:golgin subfamily A member 6-like protein 22 isoform X2 [Osmerus mordax]|uniref:golgin subfamily A member 6-like protein 22 isoform X2 n=1 Tax=Osmerus mordax TaxID=8014 RepID=UPI00350F5E80